jgi:WD40 repeat protein
VLTHLLKPHKGAITTFGVSSSGTSFATSGLDNSVFFFHIEIPLYTGSTEDMETQYVFDKSVKFIPLGFIEVTCPAYTISWISEASGDNVGSSEFNKNPLLITYKNGIVKRYNVPQGGKSLLSEGSFAIKESSLEEQVWELDFSSDKEKDEEKDKKDPKKEKERERDILAPSSIEDPVAMVADIPERLYQGVSAIHLSGQYILFAATNLLGYGELRVCDLENTKISK